MPWRCWPWCWRSWPSVPLLDPDLVRRAAGVVLIGWAAWHALYGHRHRVRFGMTTGMAGLGAWSFLMAMAHGAGLMLIPLLAPLGHRRPAHAPPRHGRRLRSAPALAAVAIHSLAMLATTGGGGGPGLRLARRGGAPARLGQSRPGVDGGAGPGGGVAAGVRGPAGLRRPWSLTVRRRRHYLQRYSEDSIIIVCITNEISGNCIIRIRCSDMVNIRSAAIR